MVTRFSHDSSGYLPGMTWISCVVYSRLPSGIVSGFSTTHLTSIPSCFAFGVNRNSLVTYVLQFVVFSLSLFVWNGNCFENSFSPFIRISQYIFPLGYPTLPVHLTHSRGSRPSMISVGNITEGTSGFARIVKEVCEMMV